MAEEVDAVRGVIRLGQGGDVVVVAGVDERVAEDEGRRHATAGDATSRREHGEAGQKDEMSCRSGPPLAPRAH